jgi:tetratricopeptide (TPR) repeat protein
MDSTAVFLELWDVAADSMVGRGIAVAHRTQGLQVPCADAMTKLLGWIVDPGREIDLSRLRNRTPAAIALWILGERAYRQSRFAAAHALYLRALQADSQLIQAALKGAQAAEWLHDSGARELAQLAVENDSALVPRYSHFARGLLARERGLADSAVAWLESALRVDPEWAEAHMAVGDVYYHLLPSRAPLDSLAARHFERAAAADTGFSPPLFHLIEIALRSGDVRRADSLLDHLREFEPDTEGLAHLGLMRACVTEGVERMDWRQHARDDALAVLRAGAALSVAGAQLGCGREAFRAILDGTDRSGVWWSAIIGYMGSLLAAGKDAEASGFLDSLRRGGVNQVMALQMIGALAGQPMAAAAASAAQFLRGIAASSGYGSLPADALLLLGTWEALHGDPVTADSIARVLEAKHVADGVATAQTYARAVWAHAMLARDDTAGAMARLQETIGDAGGLGLGWGFAEPLPVERLRLAELLLAQGRHGEAIDAASVFDHPEPIVFLALIRRSLQIRVDAAEAQGRRNLAATFRARLRELDSPVTLATGGIP